jgi:hypothetical protein
MVRDLTLCHCAEPDRRRQCWYAVSTIGAHRDAHSATN